MLHIFRFVLLLHVLWLARASFTSYGFVMSHSVASLVSLRLAVVTVSWLLPFCLRLNRCFETGSL